MSASALLIVSFIDKSNLSGIELIILDRPLHERLWADCPPVKTQAVEQHLDIHRRGLATT